MVVQDFFGFRRHASHGSVQYTQRHHVLWHLRFRQKMNPLARASGIPARVVNGLAFAPSFAGYERAFIPHAWVQAYVDGEWHGYDAALLGFDAGHIALSYGSGESSGFYASVTLFGNLKVLDAQPLPATP